MADVILLFFCDIACCDNECCMFFGCYVTRVYSWLHVFFLLVQFYFGKQEMFYCSDDAPRTWERNVNLNKNTSENVALNKMFHPDERVLNFVFNSTE